MAAAPVGQPAPTVSLRKAALLVSTRNIIQKNPKLAEDLDCYLRIREHYKSQEFLEAIELFLNIPEDSYHYNEILGIFKDSCEACGGKDKILGHYMALSTDQVNPLPYKGFLAVVDIIKRFEAKYDDAFPSQVPEAEYAVLEVATLGEQLLEDLDLTA